jgi:nitrate/TMAO reductase-like tetraheme cytochrome c subunit
MRKGRLGLMAVLVVVGGCLGAAALGGFNAIMDHTNSLGFCISCHEMETTVYQEYIKSPHYQNPSGVRVVCADCHVPKPWFEKVLRKIRATNELYHKVAGTISTPEKFEAHRREMAERVWAEMKANDSRECRSCHSYDAMAFHKQTSDARQKMELDAKPRGATCIECHKGIAHKFPVAPRDDD